MLKSESFYWELRRGQIAVKMRSCNIAVSYIYDPTPIRTPKITLDLWRCYTLINN